MQQFILNTFAADHALVHEISNPLTLGAELTATNMLKQFFFLMKNFNSKIIILYSRQEHNHYRNLVIISRYFENPYFKFHLFIN